jgi:hypothetical protein
MSDVRVKMLVFNVEVEVGEAELHALQLADQTYAPLWLAHKALSDSGVESTNSTRSNASLQSEHSAHARPVKLKSPNRRQHDV